MTPPEKEPTQVDIAEALEWADNDNRYFGSDHNHKPKILAAAYRRSEAARKEEVYGFMGLKDALAFCEARVQIMKTRAEAAEARYKSVESAVKTLSQVVQGNGTACPEHGDTLHYCLHCVGQLKDSAEKSELALSEANKKIEALEANDVEAAPYRHLACKKSLERKDIELSTLKHQLALSAESEADAFKKLARAEKEIDALERRLSETIDPEIAAKDSELSTLRAEAERKNAALEDIVLIAKPGSREKAIAEEAIRSEEQAR